MCAATFTGRIPLPSSSIDMPEEPPPPLPAADWNEHDRRTQDALARMREPDPLTAGEGLAFNNRTLEATGAGNGGDPSGALAVDLIINFDGTFRWVRVPALSIETITP